ncbi:hypothetical protein LJB42_000349 [Komagataella kurtzmanii]|nr:hypothetical protein LJB42_000349 [Komagataella kurtzmanii]
MTQHEKTICVFCGSSYGNSELYAKLAYELGVKLAEKRYGIVYGGGTTGLMGAVANGCASNGGYVHGVIPEALITRERIDSKQFNESIKSTVDNHTGVTPIPEEKEYGKTTIVKDMHTRKRLMSTEANAFIALPGGYGTLEELMEIVTWSQLGIHDQPIVLFNIDGFYDGFIEFIKTAIQSGFISERNGDIIVVANTIDDVLVGIDDYKVPEGRFKLKWNDECGEAH